MRDRYAYPRGDWPILSYPVLSRVVCWLFSMFSGEFCLRLKPYLVVKIASDVLTEHCCQGWGQLHNINSNSNSNSRGFNSNSNSNSGQSPEYQLQLQLRRFQLQLQFQLRQISRISTPTPTPTPEVSTPTPIPTPEISTPLPTPTPEFQIQPQLHFKSNQSYSTKLPFTQLQCETLYELNGGMLSIYAMLSQILIKQVNIGIADDKIFSGFS